MLEVSLSEVDSPALRCPAGREGCRGAYLGTPVLPCSLKEPLLGTLVVVNLLFSVTRFYVVLRKNGHVIARKKKRGGGVLVGTQCAQVIEQMERMLQGETLSKQQVEKISTHLIHCKSCQRWWEERDGRREDEAA